MNEQFDDALKKSTLAADVNLYQSENNMRDIVQLTFPYVDILTHAGYRVTPFEQIPNAKDQVRASITGVGEIFIERPIDEAADDIPDTSFSLFPTELNSKFTEKGIPVEVPLSGQSPDGLITMLNRLKVKAIDNKIAFPVK